MIDLTQFEKPIPIECGECMLSHCETCPDHVHALNQLKQFPALLAKVEYQAKAIDELVATVDDLTVQRNKAVAEVERLHGEVDKQQRLYQVAATERDNLIAERDKNAKLWQINKRKLTAERDSLRGELKSTIKMLDDYDGKIPKHIMTGRIAVVRDVLADCNVARAALADTKGDDNNAK